MYVIFLFSRLNEQQESHFQILNNNPVSKKRERDETAVSAYNVKLVARHSSILALCALINAYPYEVVEWMPKILMKFCESISNPEPISATIKLCFANFKRTHEDNWHEDVKMFTEEESNALNELLPTPSYFV